MRTKPRREFFIPKNPSEKREGPTKGTEIYLFTDEKGRPCAKGFRGRAQKPTFHHYYQSEAQREKSLERWIEGEKIEAAQKKKYRDRMKAAHSLEIGQILCCSWGHEQTNVDFYQVVDLPSQYFVTLRKIASEVESSGELSMQGKATAKKDEFIGEPFKKRPDGENVVTLTSYSFARPWNGQPRHVSWYA